MMGDCLERLKEIPDGSIDLICADPPYGTTECAWDSVIPLDAMWTELKRVIKPNGAIVMSGSQPFTTLLIASNLAMFKYCWIWEKPQGTGFFNAKRRPMVAHEEIIVFYNKQPTYNPQKTTGHNPVNSFTKKLEVANLSQVYGAGTKDIVGGGSTERYPRSVMVFSSDKQKNKSTQFKHPTQKPLALMEYLIKTYSNEGEVVLDFSMGSGTTGLAAAINNRSFIGIELNEGYFDMATVRIKQQSDLKQIDLLIQK